MYNDRVLENIGDVMSWGSLVLNAQDCLDCQPPLVTHGQRL